MNRLTPSQLDPTCTFEKVASTYPSSGTKKSCSPRLACSSDNVVGDCGTPSTPVAVAVNVFVASFTEIVDWVLFPDAARKGVL
jgi:hypothetical protein